MRKVTQNISAAFKAGVSKSEGATATDGQVLSLHGNPIARRHNGRLEISWCGWVTATTEERLNGVLSAFGSAFRVARKNRKPVAYAAGITSPMDSRAWVAVSDIKLEGVK